MAEKRQAPKAPGVPRAEKGARHPASLSSPPPPRLDFLSSLWTFWRQDVLDQEAGRSTSPWGARSSRSPSDAEPGAPPPRSRRPQEAGDVPFALGLLLGVY